MSFRMEMPPPGWYDDPAGAGDLVRWWDGSQWTARMAAMHNGVPVEAPAYPPGPATAQPSGPAPAPPGGSGDVSLTEWFQSIPVPGLAEAQPGPAGPHGS